MDAYDNQLRKKNLADSVAIYGRSWERFRPPMYTQQLGPMSELYEIPSRRA